MTQAAWRYVGRADDVRIEALAHPLPNADLPDALRLGLALNCFHREPRDNDPTFKRAVFCGTVDTRLFDWFFNASTGYRGAFFESPECGSRANRMLIDKLAELLVQWALSQRLDNDREWVLASLSKPSAKAWLAEYPGLCPRCAGEWSNTYVSALRIENSRWETSGHIHSAWGCQAPELSKVRIFGGFIDNGHNEWLAAHKAERAKHIWEHGWS